MEGKVAYVLDRLKVLTLSQNYGIVAAFGLGFILLLLIFTELNTSSAYETLVTRFKRKSKSKLGDPTKNDQESQKLSMQQMSPQSPGPKGPAANLSSNDIFSWFGINYVVNVSGGQRKLLDNVSGYVAPGKLTALMGESGAGKTTLLNVLAQRTTSGVVTGDRLVNGQPLPRDFQSQT